MTARLSVRELQLREMTEADWQAQVTQLAEALGYSWCHLRPARTTHGWRVPVEGPLGEGFPDLMLFGRGRTIFVELKRQKDTTEARRRERQAWVQGWIREHGGGECYQWRPDDIDDAIRILEASR